MRSAAILAALLTGGCGSVSGVVRDAATGQPVAGAIVRMSTTGWGRRDGDLVWDAETVHEARADAAGRFRFARDGGGRLQVVSSAGSFDHGSLCSRSPMTVWVGGPNAGRSTDRPLILLGGKPGPHPMADDARAISERDLGIRLSGEALAGGLGALEVEAPRGAAFVAGTGDIPAWPSAHRFRPQLSVRIGDCGWLFVNTATGRAVIATHHGGAAQDPGGDQYGVLSFTLL